MKKNIKTCRQQLANPFYGESYSERLKKAGLPNLSEEFDIEVAENGFTRMVKKTNQLVRQDRNKG